VLCLWRLPSSHFLLLSRLIAVEERDAPLFMVVDFMELGNLCDYLHDNRATDSAPQGVTHAEMVDFCTQIATGLEFLISRNITHKNLMT
jgi:hypothetical protein